MLLFLNNVGTFVFTSISSTVKKLQFAKEAVQKNLNL